MRIGGLSAFRIVVCRSVLSDGPGFVRLYEQHIAREEAELLPMATRLLSDVELDRIGLSMRRRRGVVAVTAAIAPQP